MENRMKMCRLCLRASENVQALEANTTVMLDKLKLKINSPASRESSICTNCAETLETSFDFITMCVDEHQYIMSYLINKENSKVDLKKVYLSKNENDLDIPKDHNVCGFCVGLVKSCSGISLDYELRNVMLERCLPELDLSIIENPIICVPCHKSLDRCFHFVNDCLRIEEKIQKYCEAERIDSKDLVELANIQEYTSRITLKSEEYSNTLDVIKVETLCEDERYANDEVKHDGRLLVVEEQKLNNAPEFTSNNTLVCKEGHDKYDEMVDMKRPVSRGSENEIKQENVDVEELENPKFLIKEDGSLMKVQDRNGGVQQFPTELEDSKFLIEEDIEVKTDQDDFGSCQESVDEYKIDDDPSEQSVMTPKKKKYIKPNLLTRRKVSEVMVKCALCSFETKHKKSLKQHFLTHKSAAEINMFKCDMCPFETKHRNSFKYHLRTHKSPSEINMFKCESCSFETKHKQYLRLHLLVHKSSAEVTMFKCEMCPYKGKRKDDVKKHGLIHKSVSEINMFKCKMCSYETKLKSRLNRHFLIHKSAAEIKMFKCEMCSYETKHKNCIRGHMLVHRSPSEIKMFKCEMCSFETRYKTNLKIHLLTHETPADINIFKCETCAYETKRNSNLTKHRLIHKNNSKIKIFKCKMCSFESRYKANLMKHSITHENSSQIDMLKCGKASYETRSTCLVKKDLSTQ